MYTATTAEKEASSMKNSAGVSHLKSDLKDAANDAREHADRVGADIKEVAQEAGQKMRHMLDAAGTDLAQLTDTVAAEVRQRPVQSSVIALGAGVILGMLLRR